MHVSSKLLKPLAMICIVCVGFFLAGCNNSAEVPTGGEGADTSETGAEEGDTDSEDGANEPDGTDSEGFDVETGDENGAEEEGSSEL